MGLQTQNARRFFVSKTPTCLYKAILMHKIIIRTCWRSLLDAVWALLSPSGTNMAPVAIIIATAIRAVSCNFCAQLARSRESLAPVWRWIVSPTSNSKLLRPASGSPRRSSSCAFSFCGTNSAPSTSRVADLPDPLRAGPAWVHHPLRAGAAAQIVALSVAERAAAQELPHHLRQGRPHRLRGTCGRIAPKTCPLSGRAD